MDDQGQSQDHPPFLGTGWSFPPEFMAGTGREGNYGRVVMSSDEKDILESLKILFGTTQGERFLNPKYGLDMHENLFEAISTTMKTFSIDRIKLAILIYEPRINLLSVELDTSAQFEGRIAIVVDYEVRATNSRFNLVYPFYTAASGRI